MAKKYTPENMKKVPTEKLGLFVNCNVMLLLALGGGAYEEAKLLQLLELYHFSINGETQTGIRLKPGAKASLVGSKVEALLIPYGKPITRQQANAEKGAASSFGIIDGASGLIRIYGAKDGMIGPGYFASHAPCKKLGLLTPAEQESSRRIIHDMQGIVDQLGVPLTQEKVDTLAFANAIPVSCKGEGYLKILTTSIEDGEMISCCYDTDGKWDIDNGINFQPLSIHGDSLGMYRVRNVYDLFTELRKLDTQVITSSNETPDSDTLALVEEFLLAYRLYREALHYELLDVVHEMAKRLATKTTMGTGDSAVNIALTIFAKNMPIESQLQSREERAQVRQIVSELLRLTT